MASAPTPCRRRWSARSRPGRRPPVECLRLTSVAVLGLLHTAGSRLGEAASMAGDSEFLPSWDNLVLAAPIGHAQPAVFVVPRRLNKMRHTCLEYRTSLRPAAHELRLPRCRVRARRGGGGRGRPVRLVGSLDHLVRPRQQRRRDREAERLGGLEVHDQCELCRLLDGHVSWLCAPEDLVDVPR
jgi:hypothetical protein